MKSSFGFTATSFGFGPISKAVSIATALRYLKPHSTIEFGGYGIGLDFAKSSGAFDLCTQIRVDSDDDDTSLREFMARHDAIISVLCWNPLRFPGFKKVYLVDSLRWMWTDIPKTTSHARAYFVQDYLIDKITNLHSPLLEQEIRVGPILADHVYHQQGSWSEGNDLIVSFAGCASPLTSNQLLTSYCLRMAKCIIDLWSKKYSTIRFCTNRVIGREISKELGSTRVMAGYLDHQDFIASVKSCRMLMTTPGITGALEAAILGTPMCFLPPINYSQSLMANLYAKHFGIEGIMTLENLGIDFNLHNKLSEKAGVELVNNALHAFISSPIDQTKSSLTHFNSKTGTRISKGIHSWIKNTTKGHNEIAEYIAKDSHSN